MMFKPSPPIEPKALCQCFSVGPSLVETREGSTDEPTCPDKPPRELPTLLECSLPATIEEDCVGGIASVMCLLLLDPACGEHHFFFLEVFPEVCEHAEEGEFKDELKPLSLLWFFGGLGLFFLCWRPCGSCYCQRYAFPSLNDILSL